MDDIKIQEEAYSSTLQKVLEAITSNQEDPLVDRLRTVVEQIDVDFFTELAGYLKAISETSDTRELQHFLLQLPSIIADARVQEKNGDKLAAAKSTYNKVLTHFENDDFQKGKLETDELLRLSTEIGHTFLEGSAYLFQGNFHKFRKNLTEANTCLQKATTTLAGQGFWSTEISAFLERADILKNLSKYEDARRCYAEVVAIAESIGQKEHLPNANLSLAQCWMHEKDYERAIVFLQQASAQANELTQRYTEAIAIANLAIIHGTLGDAEKAKKLGKQAIQIFTETGHDEDREKIENWLKTISGPSQITDHALNEAATQEKQALQALMQGNFEDALAYRQQALSLVRTIDDVANEVIFLGKIGNIYWERLGRYEEAVHYFETALDVLKRINNNGLKAWIYSLLAQVKKRIGAKTEAANFFKLSIDLAKDSNHPLEYAKILINAGNNAKGEDKLFQAKDYYQEALKIAREQEDPEYLSLALGNLGNVEAAWEHFQKAEEHYTEGLEVATTSQYLQGIVNQTNNLGNLEYARKNYARALNWFEKSAPAAKKLGQFQTNVLFNIGKCHLQLNEPEKARSCFLEVIRLSSSTPNDPILLEARSTLSLLYNNLGFTEEAEEQWELHTRELELSAFQSFQHEKDIRVFEELTQNYLVGIERMVKAGAVEKAFLLAEKLKSIPLRAAKKISPLTMAEMSALLREQTKTTAFLHFITSKTGILVFILRSDRENIDLIRYPMELEDLHDAGKRFLLEIDKYLDHQDLDETWYFIFEQLADEMADKLTGCEIVLLSPHLLLWMMPMHAIRTSNGPLLSFFPITYLDSIQRMKLINETKPKPLRTCLSAGVGLIAPDDVYFEGEAKIVAHTFGVEPYLGREVNRLTMLDEMPDKDVIHLSVHGDWQYRASELILNFETERITVNDLKRMGLTAELVFTSGCNSAWFDPDRLSVGLEGLPTAFMEGGAKTVIAPGWTVTGAASLQTTHCFYEQLLQGCSRAEALQKAQLFIYEKPYYFRHTFFWASFSLFGDWR